jgi:hypothetical protein
LATDTSSLAIEVLQEGQHPLVDAVGQQQHFDAFLAEDFQVRAVLRGGIAVGRDEVDLVLAFLHARHILFERHGLRVAGVVGRRKAQQLGDALLVVAVLAYAFLQHLAELFPEAGVLVLPFLLVGCWPVLPACPARAWSSLRGSP